ncbi:MAG: hypothetical protein LBR22_00990 [Desulfovibrio sp.]|jgi:hypothetical protein|nr:hypothetical protein [Desulfovibrio sp.]
MPEMREEPYTRERVAELMAELDKTGIDRWCFATLPNSDDVVDTREDRLARVKEMSDAFESVDFWGDKK